MRRLGWPIAGLLAMGIAGGLCAPGTAHADSSRPAHTSSTAAERPGKPTTTAHRATSPHKQRRDTPTDKRSAVAATDGVAGTAAATRTTAPIRKQRPPSTTADAQSTAPATKDTAASAAATAGTAGSSAADARDVTARSTPKTTMGMSQQNPAGAAATDTTASIPSATTTPATAITAAPTRTLLGVVTGIIFGVFTELERLLTGPASAPAGSNVTVRSSTLQIASGISVPADWYFPTGDPPQRMILLQHGFFAIGAMYSDTAAALAEKTDSIVVMPTLTSNPFADGGLWVNGVGMQQAVARLFVGDRASLTASALAAGYAQHYHLAVADARLPAQFVLAGHSAGGALVSGAAGYLVDYGAATDLVGVLLLDAVTTGDQLSGALATLATYEQQTGRYVPVQEIGSPPNLWNFISNVNSALSQARPDQFDGVVFSGGVHTDSMGGGSAISELLVHLLAGSPEPQNPLALRELSVQWVNDWFEGDVDNDDNLPPGSTVSVTTPRGTAVGTVIGTRRPAPVSADRSQSVA